nr:hypothetical protein [Rhizobium leguminosarum]
MQKALHLCLCLKSTAGKSFKCFGDDRRNRLSGNQNVLPGCPGKCECGRFRRETPITVQQPSSHAVANLLAVFLPLMLADAGKEILDEDVVWTITELDRWAFKSCSCRRNRSAHFVVDDDAAREPRDIVNDDDTCSAAVLYQELEHCREAWAIIGPSSLAIREDHRQSWISPISCEFPNTRFL